MYPDNLRYSQEHEWVRIESEGVAVVGITFFAQDQLGDVVFLDLPEVGTKVQQFQKLGEIESVKTVSDLFCPVSGEVLAINDEAVQNPEIVNKEPYGDGWLIKVSLQDPSELSKLMDSRQYQEMLSRPQRGH